LIEQPLLMLNITGEEQNQLDDNLICASHRPYERFTVVYNQPYRFRLIATGSEFNYQFSIDNHNLTILAIDSVYVQPYEVQQIWIYIGQRHDVLVTMNQGSLASIYWIRAVIITNDSDQFFAILRHNNTTNQSVEPILSPLPQNQDFLLNSMPLVPINVNTNFSLKPLSFDETHILHINCVPSAHC
ncbi:unnamed protein product, partial [Rotaria sordida]